MDAEKVNTEEAYTIVNGLRIAYQLSGDKNAKPVLALHGWLDNSATYNRLIPSLSNVRICAMDFVGHGLSDHRPDGTRYHLVDHLYEIDGLLDHLGWDSCVLIGHSMGAGLAAFYASIFPDRVEKLILLEGLAPPGTEAEDAPATIRRAIQEFKKLSNKKRKAVYADYDDAVGARMVGMMKVSESAARALCSRGLKECEGGWMWRTDPRLMTTSTIRFTEELVQSFLSQIKCPALLLLAADGLLHAFPKMQGRIQHLVNCQVLQLPGGHHFHLEESAELVAAEVNRFLAV